MDIILGLLCSIPNLFFLQLVAADWMFAQSMHRRNRFQKRAMGFGLSLLGLNIALLVLTYTSVWLVSNLLYHVVIFLFSLLYLWLLYDEKLHILLLCATSGYMAQHTASQFCQAALAWDRATLQSDPVTLLAHSTLTLAVFATVYGAIYYIFARHAKNLEDAGSVKYTLLHLSVATLIVVLFLSSVRDAYAGESFVLMVVSRIFSVFCCIVLLYMRSIIIERRETETENNLLRELGALREKQYAESKETIELINIKAHDMRHQLGKLKTADEEEIREVISIYDSTIQTGNETLDTLLTEKSIFCEKHGITLSCMIDGGCLTFMTVGDICSIFGNALENAIEAVMEIEETEKRLISFRVRERMGMVAVNLDNNFSGQVQLVGGLPRSTKGDDRYHGFGVKSIRRTAEKYDGEVTVTVDDMFHLTILIPIPESRQMESLGQNTQG